MWWWIAAAWAAPCEQELASDAFGADADRVWALAVAGDALSFRQQMVDLQARIPCIADPIAPGDAARFHRNRAALSLDAGDPAGARSAASAMERLATFDQLNAWKAEHPAVGALTPVAAASPVDLPASLAATVYVDGTAADQRAPGHALILQVFGADGQLVDATWLDARQPVPAWVGSPPVSCAERVAASSLVDASARAEAAFVALDLDGFEAALRDVAIGLPCVDGLLDPSEAAAIHRLQGLRQYTRGAERLALRSFQQARQLDPLFVVDRAAMPEGGALDALWTQAGALPSPAGTPIEPPDGLAARVDGVPTALRAASVPQVLQLHAADGRVAWSGYIPAFAPVPDLGAASLDAAVDALPPARRLYVDDEARFRSAARRQGFIAAGAVALLGSGLAYRAHVDAVVTFNDARSTVPALVDAQRRGNQAATAATVLGGASLACFGLALVF